MKLEILNGAIVIIKQNLCIIIGGNWCCFVRLGMKWKMKVAKAISGLSLYILYCIDLLLNTVTFIHFYIDILLIIFIKI